MSSGAKVISAFIRETVAGTTPASGDWSLLKRPSWGVKPTQNKGENNEIGGSRMAQGATPGTVDVGGDVGTKFRWGQHDDFLAVLPVLYGEMRVGSRVVSQEISTADEGDGGQVVVIGR